MNYLAHLYLSGDDPEWMLGGLLGDFVKGPLRGDYPPQVERGIALHRAIDAWVDRQPQVQRASARFQPPFRRFGGIIVDVCYDHLLACRWREFHPQPLADYATGFYRTLRHRYHQLPASAQRFADNAPKVQLLERYTEPDAIATALTKIAKRLSRPIPLEQAMAQVERDKHLLAQEFEELFPKLRHFAATTRQNL